MKQRRRSALLALLLAPAGAIHSNLYAHGGQPDRAAAARRGQPRARVATAVRGERGAERKHVVEDTNTLGAVKVLNRLSLSEHRCHSVTADAAPEVDAFGLVADDIALLSDAVRSQLEAKHADLTASAQHFFGAGNARQGKRVRPVIVLLMGQATAAAGHAGAHDAAAERQRRLASITEMIHTASLVHDDVLDAADTRRGGDAVHKMYSNKAAVLSGDFLLARASVALARLERASVTQEMAKSLEALVQGEIMQLKSSAEERLSLEYYLTKSYCKTASLMAFSCKSAALLSDHAIDSEVAVAAEKFGYHFGLAFQVIDDLLDFTGTADELGKPGLQDMALGLTTAPVLYAADEFPELKALIERKFAKPGDVELSAELVGRSRGLARTKELATFHAQAAVDACCSFPPSQARDGLIQLCHVVLSRSS